MSLKSKKVKSEMLLRKAGAKLGIDVKMSDEERFLKLLKHHNIELIFDIGANTGQYASTLFELGYKGMIVSFEPLEDAYRKLEANAKKYSNWIIADRCAIGDIDGEIEINVSSNSVSSSLLRIKSEHLESSPESKQIRKDKVQIFKLDSIFGKFEASVNTLIKVDTQGYEENVLKGAQESLKKVKGVQLELSLVELYEGQKLMPEMIQLMERYGFTLQNIEAGFVDKKTGRLLQTDGTFFRKEAYTK